MASKPKVKQSTDWVGQIINAASYAVRADTLDSMLNQIPGLMQQNAQINAQRDFEIDKHNDAVELEKQKLVDDKLFKDTQLDYQLIGALNDPTSSAEERHKAMVALKNSNGLKTEDGRAALSAFMSKNFSSMNQIDNFNKKFSNIEDYKRDGQKPSADGTSFVTYTDEDYLNDLKDLHNQSLSNNNLSKHSSAIKDRIDNVQTEKENLFWQQVGMSVTFSDDISEEQKRLYSNILSNITNPTQAKFALEFLGDNKHNISFDDNVNLIGKINDMLDSYAAMNMSPDDPRWLNAVNLRDILLSETADIKGFSDLGGAIVELDGRVLILDKETDLSGKVKYYAQDIEDGKRVGDKNLITKSDYDKYTNQLNLKVN